MSLWFYVSDINHHFLFFFLCFFFYFDYDSKSSNQLSDPNLHNQSGVSQRENIKLNEDNTSTKEKHDPTCAAKLKPHKLKLQ